MALDYATLGTIDIAVAADLDAETPTPALATAYQDAGILQIASPDITALAAGCVWRIEGSNGKHLLRSERGQITVFDESYGSRSVTLSGIDKVGLVRRRGYPTCVVEADGVTYGVPLHQASTTDQRVVDLIEQAFEHRYPIELETRRSVFWGMDGSIDEYTAVITGLRVG